MSNEQAGEIQVNRRYSRQEIKPISRKPKVLITALVITLSLMIIFLVIYIFSNSDKQLVDNSINEDNIHDNRIIIEGLGAFSFNPNTITTARSDLYKETEFSIFDVVINLDNEKLINAEYYFDESIDSYIVNSINGMQYWAYIVVDKSSEMIKTGFLTDKQEFDNSNDYILVKISKEDFQYAYGVINQNEQIEEADNELLTLSEKAINQILEGSVDTDLVNELKYTGYNKETIDLVENELEGYLPKYADGKYEGTADAHNGKITVEVTIYEGEIIFIEVISHEETAPKLIDVFSIIPINILKNQSTEEIDTVSGATEASEGYIEAVSDALRKAINQSGD